MDIRNIVLDDVISILENKNPLHKVLLSSLRGIEDARDKSFAARLVRGTVERALSLDIIIDGVSSIKTAKQKPIIRNILRTAVYQIVFMDGVTDFAAVNEAVKLAGKRGFRSLNGFVNGVLRTICRKKDDIISALNAEGRKNFSFRYSVPEWITGGFCKLYGEEKTENAFKYFLNENRISIRVNTSKTGRDTEFVKKIPGAEPNLYMDDCFYITGQGSIEENEDFKKGLFTVQDMSSALAGYCCRSVLNGRKAKVLDLCAAPGGKSMYLADSGMEVTACDISESKLSIMRENMDRCGFREVSLMMNDALVFNEEFEERFELVLCDLPCSGLGIIGKKPDIKYNMTKDKVRELTLLQRNILKNAVRYVSKNGYLVYSTCTVTKEENLENAGFITSELGLKGMPVKSLLPEKIGEKTGEDPFIQILPGEFGSDGFFISCFKKA